jgi:hypothetical protein
MYLSPKEVKPILEAGLNAENPQADKITYTCLQK